MELNLFSKKILFKELAGNTYFKDIVYRINNIRDPKAGYYVCFELLIDDCIFYAHGLFKASDITIEEINYFIDLSVNRTRKQLEKLDTSFLVFQFMLNFEFNNEVKLLAEDEDCIFDIISDCDTPLIKENYNSIMKEIKNKFKPLKA